jgi:hypothetical protein
MRNKDVNTIMKAGATALLLAGLAACGKKEAPAEPAEAATAAAAAPAPAAASCHPALQKLMDALPAKPEIEGQKVSDRQCKSGMASVTYGTGEPVEIRFELSALKYEESDLEPLGQKDGQDLLDSLRKTMEAKIVVDEAHMKGAALTAGRPEVDVMTPAERARVPRQLTLPNGVKAMVSSSDSNGWELDSVMSDRQMLVISRIDNRKENDTDEAAVALGKLAAEVQYDKLK